MSPEFLISGRQSAAGNCVSPRVLAFVPYDRGVCDGKTATEYRWYSMDQWQQATVPPVVEEDMLRSEEGQPANLSIAAWRTEGCPSGSTEVKQLVQIDLVQLKRILTDGVVQQGIVHQTPWAVIAEVALDFAASQTLISFTPSALPGWSSNYGTMWLKTELIFGTNGRDMQVNINLDTQEIHRGIVRANGAEANADLINPTYVFPFPVGNPAVTKTVTKLLQMLDGETNPATNMTYKLSIVGWSY